MKIEEDLAPEVDEEIKEAYHEIKRKKHAFREEHALKRHRTAYEKNKSMDRLKEVFEEKGLDSSLVEERMRNRSRSKSLAQIKEKREDVGGEMMDED